VKIFSGGKLAEEKLAICAKENRAVSSYGGVVIAGWNSMNGSKLFVMMRFRSGFRCHLILANVSPSVALQFLSAE